MKILSSALFLISSLVSASTHSHHRTSSDNELSSSHDFEYYPRQVISNVAATQFGDITPLTVDPPSTLTGRMIYSNYAMDLFECEQLCAMDPKCKGYSWLDVHALMYVGATELDAVFVDNCRGTNDTSLHLENDLHIHSGLVATDAPHIRCNRAQHGFLHYQNYNFLINADPKTIIDFGLRTTEIDCAVQCQNESSCFSYSYNQLSEACYGSMKKSVKLNSAEGVMSGRKIVIRPACEKLTSNSA